MTLQNKKQTALEAYNLAKAAYIANPTKENWITFCDAKRTCMLLGIILQPKRLRASAVGRSPGSDEGRPERKKHYG